MTRAPTLAPAHRRPDRYRRHQLVFEGACALALVAVTGRTLLVAVASLVLLPALRATWVERFRGGAGLLPSLIAVAIAHQLGGVPAATAVTLLGLAWGPVRDRAAPRRG